MSPKEVVGLNKKAEQIKLINCKEILRQAVHDLSADDEKLKNHVHLYHWLQENKFERLRRPSVRQEKGINELVDKPLHPKLETRMPYFFDGIGGVPVSYFHTGYIEFAPLIDEFGKDGVILHVAQCLAKKEKIVYELDKTWTGTVEDFPPERAIGLYGIYDAHGYSLKHNASLKVLQAFGEWAKMVIRYFPEAGHVIRAINGSIMKPIVGDRFDFTVRGEHEDWKIVASRVRMEQFEDFKKRAEVLKATWH